MRLGRSAASSRAARSACASPVVSSGMSLCPWKRCSAFHTVWPCRHSTSRTGAGRGSAARAGLRPDRGWSCGRISRAAQRDSPPPVPPAPPPAVMAGSGSGIIGQSFHSDSSA